MKTTVRIRRVYRYNSPEHLLIQCGYHYYNKKGGGYSYIKPDEPRGRFEAHVRSGEIHIHYDVWIGKNKHMTLPSSWTLQQEEERIRKIMFGELPETPIVNKKNERKRQRAKAGIVIVNQSKKSKEQSLPQKDLLNIDWKKVKNSTITGEDAIYPQSTTCTLYRNVIRWLQTKLTPWL